MVSSDGGDDGTSPASASGPQQPVARAPIPRPFPVNGEAPGPRCGHTLTALAGPNGDLSGAKLVLFGATPSPPYFAPPAAAESLPPLCRTGSRNLSSVRTLW